MSSLSPSAPRANQSVEEMYTLSNSSGMMLKFIPQGGKVVSLHVPDRNGKFSDVLLGFDTASEYVTGNPYFGAIIGRYANRIQHGKFELNGVAYQLPINNGPNTLHGGPRGFHQANWKVRQIDSQHAELFLHSPHLEENFPGGLSVKVTYRVSDANEWIILYEATTDRPTILNLTHHAFFNLKGEGQGDILSHRMMINADRFCAVNGELIPTGELKSVQGTPLDFTKEKEIGEHINHQDDQISLARGFDHNWVLNKIDHELSLAARVSEPITGRTMDVLTTEPGLQFYSGNFLDGSDRGKGGKVYGLRSAFCLETQHFPDTPHHPHFPTVQLNPDEIYRQTTVYRFGVMD